MNYPCAGEQKTRLSDFETSEDSKRILTCDIKELLEPSVRPSFRSSAATTARPVPSRPFPFVSVSFGFLCLSCVGDRPRRVASRRLGERVQSWQEQHTRASKLCWTRSRCCHAIGFIPIRNERLAAPTCSADLLACLPACLLA